ncbi:lytic murein transglycosylase [Pelagovum pacificum]|uniref:Lytic murein transglycosylase n=1 Tax=Pelagovum pacificum TaxID=2588711 RepID=A0A5C5GG03_9RHOB|nr:lytic murein transglycosylase [Pelagovum pacificum]QQA43187.1 lytic murein transglycosylase [Pelagovum pacificum]TNY33672.1 lytic murein transglycosylase [Pelagovum pacificum]
MKFRLALPLALAGLTLGLPAAAQQCGGPFPDFVQGLKQEAVSRGHDPATADAFLASVRQDPEVIAADRRQGVFQRDFIDFSRRLISQNRIDRARANASQYDATFNRIESEYGIPRGVLLAFWAFETDFGAVQGDFNTANALVTLAHDCRRPELFRPQIFAAMTLFERGDFDPATTTGAWAGEIGQVQMLPEDIITSGRDGDGDGHVDLKGSAQDALMSGGSMLSSLGWRPGEPWLQEIVLPQGIDMTLTGLDHELTVGEWQSLGVTGRNGALGASSLPASVLMPMGRNGPAFLAYPNFRVYFEWNQSLVYVTTAAYFGTRLEGAPVYDPGNPDPGLNGDQMVALQQRLVALGHDVGDVDGILGEKTRAAVQAEQMRLGLPPDAWPTVDLLNRL